jgi:hypothetical protein
MSLDQAFANAQPQTQPRLLAADKGLEQALTNAGGNAAAGIHNANLYVLFRLPDLDLNGPAARQGIQGIEEQVDQHLVNLLGVDFHQNPLVCQVGLQVDLLAARPAFHQSNCTANDLGQIGSPAFGIGRPGKIEE